MNRFAWASIVCECAHFANLIKLSLIIIDANAFYATNARAHYINTWTWLNAICPEHLGEWKRAHFTIHQRLLMFWARVCVYVFVVSSTPARYEEIIIREKYKFCFFFIFKCITVLSVLRKKWESQVRGLECLQDPKSTENSRAGYWTEIKVSSHCSITSFDALSDCNLYSLNLAVGTMESDFKLTRDGFFLSILDLVWFGRCRGVGRVHQQQSVISCRWHYLQYFLSPFCMHTHYTRNTKCLIILQ